MTFTDNSTTRAKDIFRDKYSVVGEVATDLVGQLVVMLLGVKTQNVAKHCRLSNCISFI